MTHHAVPDAPSAQPVQDFSHSHAGITAKLQALAGLPALLAAAEQARRLAADALAFFDDVIEEHHGAEERELFPAVIASARPGAERAQAEALARRLTDEHRRIEAAWARLVPGLKAAAKGHETRLDPAALQQLVDTYLAHAGFEEREYLPLAQTILGRDSNHLAALAVSLHMRHTVPATLARFGHRI